MRGEVPRAASSSMAPVAHDLPEETILKDFKGRPYSVIEGRDPLVLTTMLSFYASPGARVLDATANRRKMWTGVEHKGEMVFMDIDPEVKPDVVGDFREMPFPADNFDVIVFDPPHLPVAAASPQSSVRYKRDYGLARSAHADNISECFGPFLREAARVLKADGLVFAKLKDFVHNHRYQWTLADWIVAVRAQEGLTACDMIVKRDPSGGALKSSLWESNHHVRNAHCWWVVVRKGRCERRKSA